MWFVMSQTDCSPRANGLFAPSQQFVRPEPPDCSPQANGLLSPSHRIVRPEPTDCSPRANGLFAPSQRIVHPEPTDCSPPILPEISRNVYRASGNKVHSISQSKGFVGLAKNSSSINKGFLIQMFPQSRFSGLGGDLIDSGHEMTIVIRRGRRARQLTKRATVYSTIRSLGANNPLARGEQSDPRTAENARPCGSERRD